jgi:hypothetical protein
VPAPAEEGDVSGWVIGFAIGGAVVVVVVVLLLALITLARHIAGRAEAILAALHAARDNTAGLGELTTTNRAVARINAGAVAARETVEGGAS